MQKNILSLVVLCAVSFAAGCGAEATNTETAQINQTVSANSAANRKPEPPMNASTPFEKALFSVRVGDFEQVFSFARKDGGVLTSDDIEFFKTVTENEQGREINRRLKSEDNKFIVAGTNFVFKSEQLEKLQQRFQIRDYTESNDGADLDLNKYRTAERERLAKTQPEIEKK